MIDELCVRWARQGVEKEIGCRVDRSRMRKRKGREVYGFAVKRRGVMVARSGKDEDDAEVELFPGRRTNARNYTLPCQTKNGLIACSISVQHYALLRRM